jgi:hypothetical protein
MYSRIVASANTRSTALLFDGGLYCRADYRQSIAFSPEGRHVASAERWHRPHLNHDCPFRAELWLVLRHENPILRPNSVSACAMDQLTSRLPTRPPSAKAVP